MLTDTHAHLFDSNADELKTLIDEAKSTGVGMVINTSTSTATAQTVLAQCRRFPQNLKAAVGISPFDTVEAGTDWADKLKSIINNDRQSNAPMIVAIGEIGLDDTNPIYPSLSIQMPFFRKQLEIAVDTDLPAVIHSRGIEKKTAEICHEIGVSKAVFHCFTGDLEALEYIIDCGYYVSISGIVTYKNSHLRGLIHKIPIDRLLIESDAPYLSPIPQRGKKNRPAFLVHTAREICGVLGMDEIRLSEALSKNVHTVFGF